MAEPNVITKVETIQLPELTVPETPASGFGRIYVKSTGLFFIGDDGVEIGPLGSGGGSSDPTIVLKAAAGYPTTTSGASFPGRVEFGTNDRDVFAIDFDATSIEYAFWQVAMPDDYDGGTVTATFYWFTPSSTNTHTCRWGIQAVSSDDAIGSLDQAYGTIQEVDDDASATANAMRVSAATAALTIAGSPAAGDLVTFRVKRDPTHGNDDLNVDARLLQVVIEYTPA